MRKIIDQQSLRFAVLAGAAFMGLGMAMPSCPGQQEMKDQMTALQTANDGLNKRVQTLTGQVTQLNTEMSQVKQLLQPMANAIQAQKTAMDQLDANMKTLAGKGGAGKGKAVAKKKR
ncbi:hypothetical protein WDW37_08580 [Bdellovibrionota bacterium FG-1]